MLSAALVENAVYPWSSPDAGAWMFLRGGWVPSDLTTHDSQSQIERCMSCPFADECVDCVSGGGEKKKRGRKRMDYTAIDALLSAGRSLRSIAAELGVSKRTVIRRKQEIESRCA